MPSWELQLIGKIVEDGDLDTPCRIFGIDSGHFENADAALIFQDLFDWWHNRRHYGEVLPLSWIEEHYPGVDIPDPSSKMDTLCDIVKQGHVRKRLTRISDGLWDQLKDDADPRDAMDYLLEEVSRLQQDSIEAAEDIDFGATSADAIRQKVRLLENAGGMLGFPWPWEVMNEDTQGVVDTELYVLYGRPKSLKTWVLSVIAEYLYTECRARIMFWCREMSPEALRRRLACISAGIDYRRYSKGRMEPEERHRLFRYLDLIKKDEAEGADQRLLITKGTQSDSDGATGSFAEIRRKAEQFRPQAIFLDSAYHMQRSTKWRDIYELCRGLKNLAVDLKVPVLCTWQANRGSEKTKGKGTDEVALGDALQQEADFLMRVLKRGTNRHPLLSLVVSGARESALQGFTINGVPAGDFSFYSEEILWDPEEDDEAPELSKRRRRKDSTTVRYGGVRPPEPDDYGEEEEEDDE